MPRSLPEDAERGYDYDFAKISYSYDYPYGLNIKPKSDLHERIVRNVMQMAKESNDIVTRRYDAWKKTDEVLTCYIQPSELENKVIAADKRKPISIVIPQSYAIMELLLTYMTAALLEAPIFRYEGSSPEDVMGAIMLQKVIEHQSQYTKMILNLHTIIRDSFAYGFGVGSPVWETEIGITERAIPDYSPMALMGRIMGGNPAKMKTQVETVLFEGNRIHSIDPYLYLPDPNVPVTDVQSGERAGWIECTNLMDLLKEENSGDLFNVRYLKHVGNMTSILCKNDNSGRGTRTNTGRGVDWQRYGNLTNPVDIVFMYVKLIPEDWKLPGGDTNKDGEYPEIWQFGVAADTIVISAKRLNLNHNRIPMAVCAPDTDGYSVAPISKLELFDGLQTVTDFLFNSFITGTRRSLNGMYVVDPNLINLNDLRDPEPGKIVRTRKAQWGRGVKDGIEQLKTDDSGYAANIANAGVILELMKNLSGATDTLSGARRKTSERVTAEEVRGDKYSSLSRLEHIAKMISWQFMHDMGYMLASQTQQLMSQETYIKTVGEWQETLIKEFGQASNYMKVSPFEILINYDVVIKDGTIPGGNFSQSWIQMFQTIVGVPELAQTIDVTRLFKAIMRELGAKNVDQFDRTMMPGQQPVMNPQVMPDQQVSQQLQAGNIIPLPGSERTA